MFTLTTRSFHTLPFSFPPTHLRTLTTSLPRAADFTHVIIGAGAVGLAIAQKLATRKGTSTLLVERHGKAGMETSSRNSEVIHAGLYYGPSSLKTALCVRGKQMLYELCAEQNIPHRIVGKWIVAQTGRECEELWRTHEFATSIGVPTHFVSQTEARELEPEVHASEAVLESPTTGILDSHTYMSYLELDYQDHGGDVAFHTTVTSVEALESGSKGYRIHTASPSLSEESSITTETLINSAGLAAIPLSNQILPPSRHITPYYAKGSYYSYSAPFPRVQTLIYPVQPAGAATLGCHLTMDLAGAIRFGPDVEWIDDPNDLSVNESQLPAALDEIERYLPGVQRDKVRVDCAGVRPKLGKGSALARVKGDGFSDFIIRKEEGFEGFVNLLGIESPGLTSSLAIAEMVDELLYK